MVKPLVRRAALLTTAAAFAAPAAPAQTLPSATPAVPTSGTAAPVTIRGLVYDSLAAGPLAGATVQAARADNRTVAVTAEADSLGRFAFAGLAPGRYVLGFLHPLLDVLGVELRPVAVTLAPGTTGDLTLAVPGPASVRSAVCPAGAADDSSGAVAGSVRDADSDAPATDATLVFTWSELVVAGKVRTERRRVPVPVRPDGSYVACGVPADGVVEASASAPGRASGVIEVTAPARGLAVQHFLLGPVAAVAADAGVRTGLPTAATGTARVVGRVATREGQPVADARVRVWGVTNAARSAADGTFSLTGLPAGTHTLETLVVGREPVRLAVNLVAGREVAVRVTPGPAVAQLDRVVVKGRATNAGRDLNGFFARRQAGHGRFLTATEIEQQKPLMLTDALRLTPGIRVQYVASSAGTTRVLRGRSDCLMRVFLDGVQVRDGASEIDYLVQPQAVAGIEVYRSAAEVPTQYNATGSGGSFTGGVDCGAVLVWTRR